MKRVILVSENFIIQEKVKSFCKNLKNVELVKIFGDVESALDWVAFNETDFALVDFFLFGFDGLDFLKVVKEQTFLKVFLMPCLIDEISKMAVHYGAICTLEYDFEFFKLQKILLYENEKQNFVQDKVENNLEKSLEAEISKICAGVGIPPHILGYKYLKEAVKLTISQPSYSNKVTTKLYPSVAKKFSTSPSRVERGIRHALEVSFTSGKLGNLNQLLKASVYTGKKLTSSQFIAILTDRLMFIDLEKW